VTSEEREELDRLRAFEARVKAILGAGLPPPRDMDWMTFEERIRGRERLAVLAEREACAALAEDWGPECYQAEGIALAIRGRP
jgi:hypothetical protein